MPFIGFPVRYGIHRLDIQVTEHNFDENYKIFLMATIFASVHVLE